MSEKLIIVESPSKATTIKKYLGTKYKVVASKGHIRDLPKSKLGVDIEKDFEPEYINIRGKSSIINELKKDASKAEKVYLATDPDREGEAIAWHLANILGIDIDSECRVTFNEITKETVNKSVSNPRKIDMNLTNAQQARRILDRIVGYKLSPVLWKKVKRGLSAGRVQSVAVKLICDREKEIEDFIPREYWNIFVELKKETEKFSAKLEKKNNKKIELSKKEEVDEILNEIEKAKYIVKEVKRGTRKRSPSPPFTTSTLQQEASRKLGFPIKRTMSIAQSLYESGKITYMRTDSIRISDEAREQSKKVILKMFGEEYYENRFYKKNSNIQDAHEGIRPTQIENTPEILKDKLKPEEYKLYKLIYNRLLASQMKDAIFDTISARIDTETKNVYSFKATGQTLKFKGFMTLYIEGKDEENNEDNESKIPDLKENEEVIKEKINPKQSFTEPPARYTEASLVKALEENGIGRPSTYATIISTIIDRMYIEKEQKQLRPTELGKIVNDLLVKNFTEIVNVEFTAEIENRFDKIAEGQEEWKQIIREFYKPFKAEIDKAETELEQVKIEDEVSDVKCEKCGRFMVVKQSRYGKFLACPGYPECNNIKPLNQKTKAPCPICGKEVYIRKTKKGRKFYICSDNKNDDKSCTYISWNEPKIGETEEKNGKEKK